MRPVSTLLWALGSGKSGKLRRGGADPNRSSIMIFSKNASMAAAGQLETRMRMVGRVVRIASGIGSPKQLHAGLLNEVLVW